MIEYDHLVESRLLHCLLACLTLWQSQLAVNHTDPFRRCVMSIVDARRSKFTPVLYRTSYVPAVL